jgi:tRNA U34 2-thiouridine synthase MnmA/TrmU
MAKKALILLSGGLDSTLAAKLLIEQKIGLTGLVFKSYFFGPSRAKKAAVFLQIPLLVVDFSKKHLQMVKSPKYGRGRAMNPCIDCHLLMFSLAKKIMEEEGFAFVASGEVLGQRPMSQNRPALGLIARESGLAGYLLRPLSARLLPETVPEKKGWLDRKKLLAISGRSRKKQIALAKKFGLVGYSQPAGGCLLTEQEFSRKLAKLLEIFPKAKGNDIELLKRGRHFFSGKVKLIVGRNEEENQKLEAFARPGDIILALKEVPGPTVLIRNYGRAKAVDRALAKAKDLILKYSAKAAAAGKLDFLIKEK